LSAADAPLYNRCLSGGDSRGGAMNGVQELGQEFKQFLLRGNVIDLAVAVVIGAAFGAVVNALVADLITPVIAAIGGQPDFNSLDFTINDSRFFYGHFLNAVISFAMIAAAVFFLVVKPVNMLMQRARREPPADPTTKKCPECLSEIPLEARRCAFCTAQLTFAEGQRAPATS
jgi:large conductance mechanosensitive channel